MAKGLAVLHGPLTAAAAVHARPLGGGPPSPGGPGAGGLPLVRDPPATRAGGRGGPDRRRGIPSGRPDPPGAGAAFRREGEARSRGENALHLSSGAQPKEGEVLPRRSRAVEAADRRRVAGRADAED